MIEILGYIFLYLIVGVVLLPYWLLFFKETDDSKKKMSQLYTYVLLWPLAMPLLLFLMLFLEWDELKNYK